MQTHELKFYFLANATTSQNNTLSNGVAPNAGKINNLEKIPTVDVIKQHRKEQKLPSEFGNNIAKTTKLNETKYNQQRNKQIKKNIQQLESSHQSKLYNGIINTDLGNGTNKTENNKSVNNYSNSVASNNSNTTGAAQQHLCHTCLQTGDLSSELKCC